MDEPVSKPIKRSDDQVKQVAGAGTAPSQKKKGKKQQEFLVVKLDGPNF